MKNYLSIIIIILLYLSCKKQESPTKNELKIIDNNLLYEAKKDSINNFYNYSIYYLNKSIPLIEMLQYENNDSVFHYRFTTRNQNQKIIYQVEVENGKVLKEYNYGSPVTFNIDLGEFLYKNYCYQCHHRNKESIGKSILQISTLDNSGFIKNYFRYNHEMELQKNELDSIYFFIKK